MGAHLRVGERRSFVWGVGHSCGCGERLPARLGRGRLGGGDTDSQAAETRWNLHSSHGTGETRLAPPEQAPPAFLTSLLLGKAVTRCHNGTV